MQQAQSASAEPVKMVLEEMSSEAKKWSGGRYIKPDDKLRKKDMQKYANGNQNCTKF